MVSSITRRSSLLDRRVNPDDVIITTSDHTVSASFSLGGLTLADWSTAAQTAFAAGVALQVGVSASQIAVGTVSESASRRHHARRGLSSAGLTVPFVVSGFGGSGSAAASGVASAIASPATGTGLASHLAASVGLRTTPTVRCSLML